MKKRLSIKRGLRRTALAAILFLWASAPHAQAPATSELASSYVEAQERGRRDESDEATRDYHRDVLLPQFSERYRAHFRDCTASVPQPESTPFSFVAAIGADGRHE
jgi:hypothetical protein